LSLLCYELSLLFIIFFGFVNAVFVVVFLFNSWFGILQVFFSEWLAMATFFTFQNNVISDVSNLA